MRPGKDTREQSTEHLIESRPSWQDVEAFARQRIQTWFQRLLDEDVKERSCWVGRATRGVTGSTCRTATVNGLGKPRRLTLSAGTITVRPPRVRGLVGPAAAVQAPHRNGGQVLPTLYPNGLATSVWLSGPPGRGRPLVRQLGRAPEGQRAGRVRRREDARAN